MHGDLTVNERHTIEAFLSDALGKAVTITAEPEHLTGGMRRATYKMATSVGSVVLSINSADYPVAEKQHALHHELYKLGAPVARPIGGIGKLDNGRWFQVVEFVPGRSATSSPPTVEDMRALGKSLGAIHALSENYFREHGIEPRHESVSWQYGSELLSRARAAEDHAIRKWLKHDTPPPPHIFKSAAALRRRAIESHLTMKAGLAHKDAHPGNVIHTDNGAVLIDLEFIGHGGLLKDLVPAVLWGCTEARKEGEVLHVTLNFDKADAFLEGYASKHALSAEDKLQLFKMVKDQAKSNVAFSQMYPIPGMGSAESADAPYERWNKVIDSWADRMARRVEGERIRRF